uniref:Uncharacterized protein n=1 Tax=Arundo donax TaxID=35708 RepID=A0A0A9BY76_ARUDO
MTRPLFSHNHRSLTVCTLINASFIVHLHGNASPSEHPPTSPPPVSPPPLPPP